MTHLEYVMSVIEPLDESQLTRAHLAELTLDALSAGYTTSSAIRAHIAEELGIVLTSKTINTHAWALVDLQASKAIIKVGKGSYRLAYSVPRAEYVVEPPTLVKVPEWARDLVSRANRFNKSRGLSFSMEDLIILWERCGGRCSVTGGEFSNEKVGQGLVKRAFAPSIDRIDPGQPYSPENCRLVMVAVNFAMNTWGEDTFLRLAKLVASTRA